MCADVTVIDSSGSKGAGLRSSPTAPPSSLELTTPQKPYPGGVDTPKTEPAHVSVIVLGQDSFKVKVSPFIHALG